MSATATAQPPTTDLVSYHLIEFNDSCWQWSLCPLRLSKMVGEDIVHFGRVWLCEEASLLGCSNILALQDISSHGCHHNVLALWECSRLEIFP